MLNTQEHADLVDSFEQAVRSVLTLRCDFAKEPRELWAKGYIYQNGELNQHFLTYRVGYSYGKRLWRDAKQSSDATGPQAPSSDAT